MEKIEDYTIKVDDMVVPVTIFGGKSIMKTYSVAVPTVAPATRALMNYIKHGLISEVSVSTGEMLDPKAIVQLKEKFSKRAVTLLKDKLPNITAETSTLLINVLMQEMLGLGDVEYLLNDEALEEIVINSSSEPVRVFHKRYGWLETNITMESEEKILNYSNIIARRVGRQITTLNPLLDAHLITGDRANAVLFPICTKGHTITIRKFARDPWTLTDFIKNKTVSSKVLSLIWLAIQYEMNILVSGGTGSGKTSFLNIVMPFMPPNHRIVSIEDSVHGDSLIPYVENGKLHRKPIGKIIDSYLAKHQQTLADGTEITTKHNLQIYTLSKEGKVELHKPSSLIRHKVSKPLYTVTTTSGKQIRVTGDHSLFSLVDNNIAAVKCVDLQVGDFLATPRTLPFAGTSVHFDLIDHLASFKDCQLTGVGLGAILTPYISQLQRHRSKAQVSSYIRNERIPITLVLQLGVEIPQELRSSLRIVPLRTSQSGYIGLPVKISIDHHLACLAGLWLADGSYDINSTIFSVVEPECNFFVQHIAKTLCNTTPKLHSDGLSLMIHSKVFKRFFTDVLDLRGDAYTKRVPAWVFTLPEKELAYFLRGYLSGDGWPRDNDVAIGSCSLGLLQDTQHLFLRLGILFRFTRNQYEDKTYQGFISGSPFLQRFLDLGGFIQTRQNIKLRAAIKTTPKESSDVIPLSKPSYLLLKHSLGNTFKEQKNYTTWKSWQGMYSKSHIGRSMLQKLLTKYLPIHSSLVLPPLLQPVESLAFNDIFWDRIISVTQETFTGYVYDLSVPGTENFISENIMCHNTRELQLPKYLYWCPLTIRQPNPEGKGEVCMYPGSYFLSGEGELREISSYVEQKLAQGNKKKLKKNVVSIEGDGDTLLAGNPRTLTYSKETIKTFSKITDREYICTITCADGTTFSVTENTKLPVLTKEGKIALLNPFAIKEQGGHIPLFTKINVDAQPQSIKLFETFDRKDIYACDIKKEYHLLEQDLRKHYTLQTLATSCGITRQSFNYYRSTGIVNMHTLKTLASLSSNYPLEYFEKNIHYLKGKGATANWVTIPRIVDEDLAYFAGFVLAEKYINSNRIIISQKEEIDYVLQPLAKRLFELPFVHTLDHKKEYHRYGLFSTVIAVLMRDIFHARKSKDLNTPQLIMRSPDEIIASFLAGYIDGDGTIREGSLSCSSISEPLIRGCKYLLTRLGIRSSFSIQPPRGYGHEKLYALDICTRIDAQRACTLLPFKKQDKIAKARWNIAKQFEEGTVRNRIPFSLIHKPLTTLKNYLTTKERYRFMYRYFENKESSMARTRLGELVALLSLRVHTTKEEEDSLRTLKELSNEDIEYVEITTVSIKKNTKHIPSYDLTPEHSKYFIAGNGNFTLVEDTMLDLLVNSLRMRPDRIILGEMRKKDQASVLFEAMHTGHSVYATVHADSIAETIDRLINPPIEVPRNLLTGVHLNVVMFRDRRRGIRRVFQVGEFLPTMEEGTASVKPNILYRWKPGTDEVVEHSSSVRIFEELSRHTGLTLPQIEKDMLQKQKILDWMVANNIRHVDQVGELIRNYYIDPETIISKVGGA